MTIRVEQKHIDEWKKFDCLLCPIALAVTEQLKCRIVEVLRHNIYIDSQRIPMPTDAFNFAHDFDYEKPVHPFTFELPI